VTLSDLNIFEQRECVTLPEDYKSFLLTSDGFKLKWSVSFRTKIQPLGQLQLNRLRDVRRISHVDSDEWISDDGGGSMDQQQQGIGIETKLVGGRRIRMLRTIPSSVQAYEIDTASPTTRVALLYGVTDLGATSTDGDGESGNSCGSSSGSSSGSNGEGGRRSRRRRGGAADPQVWYSDNSSRWFFIANSFMDYFRLMVTNLGLPDWQSAYTDIGLDPTSRQWFNFLIPNKRRSGGGSSSPMGGGSSTSTSTSTKKMLHNSGALSFVAFTGEGPAGATGLSKGLITLRDVTGTVDDTTSPVIIRRGGGGGGGGGTNGGGVQSGGSSGRSSGRGGGKTSRSQRGGGDVGGNQSKNAANWFDMNHTDTRSDRRRQQQRPGSAPMRRRGDGRGRNGLNSRR